MRHVYLGPVHTHTFPDEITKISDIYMHNRSMHLEDTPPDLCLSPFDILNITTEGLPTALLNETNQSSDYILSDLYPDFCLSQSLAPEDIDMPLYYNGIDAPITQGSYEPYSELSRNNSYSSCPSPTDSDFTDVTECYTDDDTDDTDYYTEDDTPPLQPISPNIPRRAFSMVERGGRNNNKKRQPNNNVRRRYASEIPSSRSYSSEEEDADERKFKCTHPRCNKAFNKKPLLTRHEGTHRAKEFFCGNENCDGFTLGFSRLDSYRRHVRTYRVRCGGFNPEMMASIIEYERKVAEAKAKAKRDEEAAKALEAAKAAEAANKENVDETTKKTRNTQLKTRTSTRTSNRQRNPPRKLGLC